jgi:hypothetical protein
MKVARLRFFAALFTVCVSLGIHAATPMTDATSSRDELRDGATMDSAASAGASADQQQSDVAEPQTLPSAPQPQSDADQPIDSEGKPIPLEMQQPKRILGFMPNFLSVAGGSKSHPPGWKYNFTVATHQATDYSSFFFLGLTSLTAEGTNVHPALGKGVKGFYGYAWRGFIDKTDNTYLSAWLLPSLLHEDTRYYALGKGHSIPIRALYVISRQAVTRTYGGRQTPNIAGLGANAITQIVSTTYYPEGESSIGALASKFGYTMMRDVAMTAIREFYPDIAAHFRRKYQERAARMAQHDIESAGVPRQ